MSVLERLKKKKCFSQRASIFLFFPSLTGPVIENIVSRTRDDPSCHVTLAEYFRLHFRTRDLDLYFIEWHYIEMPFSQIHLEKGHCSSLLVESDATSLKTLRAGLAKCI